MCRVLIYKGSPELVENFLYKSDSAFVQQAHESQLLNTLNLAGFGIAVWDERSLNPGTPFVYKSTNLPFFDRNLRGLSRKLEASSLLAHLRGVALDEKSTINEANLHPFLFSDFPMSMAHNGDLARFSEMRFDVAEFVRPEIRCRVQGNTDSEWIYALLMSQFSDPAQRQPMETILKAIESTYSILRGIREQRKIDSTSVVNLFLNDGESIVATRYAFDFGCYELDQPKVKDLDISYTSLWYTSGTHYEQQGKEWRMAGGANHTESILVSSEPLTLDTSTWLEVPEYSALYVVREGEKNKLGIHAIAA